jgi:hypothetical protein
MGYAAYLQCTLSLLLHCLRNLHALPSGEWAVFFSMFFIAVVIFVTSLLILNLILCHKNIIPIICVNALGFITKRDII